MVVERTVRGASGSLLRVVRVRMFVRFRLELSAELIGRGSDCSGCPCSQQRRSARDYDRFQPKHRHGYDADCACSQQRRHARSTDDDAYAAGASKPGPRRRCCACDRGDVARNDRSAGERSPDERSDA
jgi:hypothetical protein